MNDKENNTGHFNSGCYNSGHFNTDGPTIRMFNADIFEEITGIKVSQDPTCNNKVVEIDGKKYKLIGVY